MTIQVTSNDVTEVKAPAAHVEQPKSAPEAQATEQNEAPESDPEETEAKEEDEAKESDDDESEDAKDEVKDKPKKKGGFQRRIDKLNARYSAAQAELEHWKAMALKEKNAGEPKAEPATKQPAATEGKPSPDDFETHAEYVEALTDWKTEQKFKEREQKAEKSKLQTEHENVLKAHSERVKAFAEKVEDFAEVLAEVDDVTVSPAMQELLISSENGPELIYELAKNRAEFERIAKLTPLAVAREIGRLESKLSAAKASEPRTEPKRITNAPKPLEPVKASGSVAKSIDDPNLSQAEYEAIRRKQLAARKNAW